MKKLMLVAISIMSIASLVACGGGSNSSTSGTKSSGDANASSASNTADIKNESATKKLKGEIEFWSFYPTVDKMVKAFEERYPDIKVHLTVYPYDEYVAKLRSALQVGAGVPDVFLMEATFLSSLIDHPNLEDLSKPPYNGEQYLKDQYDYVVAASKDSHGALKALTFQATPGGFYYRRDLTTKYLGTDDPAKVSEAISSWDQIMALGEKVASESGGKVHVLPSWTDIATVQRGKATTGWVKDGKLNIDPENMKTYDLAKEARDRNVEAKLEDANSPGYVATIQNGSVMFYAMPTWGLNYNIVRNAPDTKGKWGLAHGPAAFWGGGTWVGLYSKGTKKELAWELLKFYTVDKEYLKKSAVENSDFISSKSIMSEIVANEKGNEFLNGQKYFEFFNDSAKAIKNVPMTKYDNEIIKAFNDSVKSYVDGKLSKDEAIVKFKKDVKTAYPDIKTD